MNWCWLSWWGMVGRRHLTQQWGNYQCLSLAVTAGCLRLSSSPTTTSQSIIMSSSYNGDLTNSRHLRLWWPVRQLSICEKDSSVECGKVPTSYNITKWALRRNKMTKFWDPKFLWSISNLGTLDLFCFLMKKAKTKVFSWMIVLIPKHIFTK